MLGRVTHLRFGLLLLMVVTIIQWPKEAEGRMVKFEHRANNSNFYSTLGLVCECCDGPEGECRSKWDAPCAKLKCHPWKYH
ncbi:hypothetical protein CDL15_Pgr025863 [Punica granatum]|uniref:Embryo surrounding factor 1 brassicaceae domain-containing protein n=1 Tax=Punica granatum TaxID=22663 RepID=A0A218WAV9_PUNGR|nr:hypothetical protein CDL15_Pgr025863 [Punica granatum]